MELRLRARSVVHALFWTIAGLTLLHCIAHILRTQFGISWVARYFDTNLEGTIPAFFSAMLMLACAALLACAAAVDAGTANVRRASWILLALVFLFLPFDELFAVHERLNAPLRRALQTSGVLGFAWVVPYGAFALAVCALTLRLLRDLPPRIRALMLASGVLYLGGALGLEMLGAYISETAGRDGIAYFAESTVEEVLEMSGLAIFMFALMEHLGGLRVAVVLESAATPAAFRVSRFEEFQNTGPLPDGPVPIRQPDVMGQEAANHGGDGAARTA